MDDLVVKVLEGAVGLEGSSGSVAVSIAGEYSTPLAEDSGKFSIGSRGWGWSVAEDASEPLRASCTLALVIWSEAGRLKKEPVDCIAAKCFGCQASTLSLALFLVLLTGKGTVMSRRYYRGMGTVKGSDEWSTRQ